MMAVGITPLQVCLLLVVATPSLALMAIAAPWLWGKPWQEKTVSRATEWASWVSFVGAVCFFIACVRMPHERYVMDIGRWFSVHGMGPEVVLAADVLSATWVLFVSVSCLLVSRFASTYMHREPGYLRFFVLLNMFEMGMQWVVLSGSLAIFFVGWEIVGLTSVLLMGFFYQRRAPVQNAFQAFMTYRVCDVGLFLSAFLLHHYVPGADLIDWVVPHSHLDIVLHLPTGLITLMGVLLLWAAMGKSAQFPLGLWLPRAMEGPTASSAVFYGALSVHAGAYLLLRMSPLLQASVWVCGATVCVGLMTACYGTLLARVQSDAKNVLACAVMTQLGLIVFEIGMGWTTCAWVHMLGHGCLRLWQFLRAPSVLQESVEMRSSLGHTPGDTGRHYHVLVPRGLRSVLYRKAINQYAADSFVRVCVKRPLDVLSRWVCAAERNTSRALGVYAFEHALLRQPVLLFFTLVGAVLFVAPLFFTACRTHAVLALTLMGLCVAVWGVLLAYGQKMLWDAVVALCCSQTGLLFTGLATQDPHAMEGAAVFWMGEVLAMGGLLFLTRRLCARTGPLDIRLMHGLAAHTPKFAVAFLVFGLALVGFPGTATFAGEDVMLESFLSMHPLGGLGLVVVLALGAITFMGTYMRVFMGPSSHAGVYDVPDMLPQESWTAVCIGGLLLVFGVMPGALFGLLGIH